MSVGLPSVCLSVPAVQEQKVCTASVDRQTHHNTLILSQHCSLPMSWQEEKGKVREVRSEEESTSQDVETFDECAPLCIWTTDEVTFLTLLSYAV